MKGQAEVVKARTENFLNFWIKFMDDAWGLDEGSGDENSNPNTPGGEKANSQVDEV